MAHRSGGNAPDTVQVVAWFDGDGLDDQVVKLENEACRLFACVAETERVTVDPHWPKDFTGWGCVARVDGNRWAVEVIIHPDGVVVYAVFCGWPWRKRRAERAQRDWWNKLLLECCAETWPRAKCSFVVRREL